MQPDIKKCLECGKNLNTHTIHAIFHSKNLIERKNSWLK